MEHLRIFIAILLSFLVFFIWEMFFVDHAPNKRQAEVSAKSVQAEGIEKIDPDKEKEAERRTVEKAVQKPDEEGGGESIKKGVADAANVDGSFRRIRVENPFYRIELDEQGGSVRHVELKEYRQRVEKDAPSYQLIGNNVSGGSIIVGLQNSGGDEFKNRRFVADCTGNSFSLKKQLLQVKMTYRSADGLAIEKLFTFKPDSYLIDLDVTIINGSGKSVKDSAFIEIDQHGADKTERYGFSGPSALIDGKLKQISVKDIKDQDTYKGKIGWLAIQDRYFLSAIVPEADANTEMKLKQKDGNLLESRLIQEGETLLSGQSRRYKYKLYFGPKRMDLLKSYGIELERVIDFGMFDFIAKPCLWFMNWVHGFIPNYGIAIILLTLLTKILLWPLGTKSYKSMNDMKRMQPLMTEIREKYKNDKKKMNEEMMGLYRVYKVNPLGGCLPMLVQLPVFFALYRMLYEAIELRHAPFFGWINDLSAPDRLFSFNITVPLMEPPYGIPVLTLIMGATMFLQQKMTPTPGDPTQAKMMTYMPIIFTVIFVNFSSGLVLYWLINNVVSISQQYYIYKKYA